MHYEITIDTNSLLSDITEMKEILTGIQKAVNSLYDAAGVLDSMWDGPAKEAFIKQFKKDHADMIQYCEDMESIIVNWEFAREKYDECENIVGELVSNMGI